jgi:hypothetical protein
VESEVAQPEEKQCVDGDGAASCFPDGALSFVHIADLHLGNTCWPTVKEKGYPSSDLIKAICLDEIAAFIRKHRPDFLFVAGDLTEVHGGDPFSCDVMPYSRDLFSRVVAACESSGTSIVAVAGDHDPEVTVLREYFPFVLEIGEIASINNVRIGGLGVRPHQEGISADFERWRGERLDFVLIHSDKIATSRFSDLGTTYVARGHLHKWKDCSSQSLKSLHPGHLYTYWDGSGKAYPTCFASGFVREGECVVESHLFRTAPRTRRFYWDVATSRFCLEGVLEEEHRASFPEWGKSEDSFWFTISRRGRRSETESMLRDVLSLFLQDIFVTPVGAEGRLVQYARDILADVNLFERFARCSVRDRGRQ